jgi:hypothetical protein
MADGLSATLACLTPIRRYADARPLWLRLRRAVIFVVFYANPVLIIWRTVTNVLIEKARCLLQSWFYDAAG